MTTTDDTALIEQIARAYAELTPEQWETVRPSLKSRAIRDAAAVLPIIRKAQADAWSEGEALGALYGLGSAPGDNPYRTQEDA